MQDRATVSIIVGAPAPVDAADACLAALASQVDDTVEVLVITDSAESIHCPDWARNVVEPGRSVPELWAAGLRLAGGDLIALTATGLVPAADWVHRTRELHAAGEPAVGGPIEPVAGGRLVDWAVYFCRYAPYMLPLAEDGLEVPGDNASYRHDVLQRYHALYEDGFWEPFVHRSMRADGHVLRVRPERISRQAPGARGSAFAHQRFQHGRVNGVKRSKGVSRARVASGLLSAPLVPLLMTARAARQVVTKRRHRLAFLVASPLMLWFYSWWALGEAVGRLDVLGGRA